MRKYKTTEYPYKVTNPFRLLTRTTVGLSDDKLGKAIDKQHDVLSKLGYDYDENYLIHFGNGTCDVMDIETAIECLALKDGADLVEFENGKYGYVGYYNGHSENWFEIVRIATDFDCED